MEKCVYDYKNSCTCAEDDKCGCDYDNNMAHDFACDYEEHKMLKKVRNSCQIRILVAGTDIIEHIHSSQRRGKILMHKNPKSVVQNMSLERDHF